MDRAELFYSNIADLYANTELQPLAIAVTLCMGIAFLVLPKKYAVIPMLLVMLSITNLQRVVFFGLDLTMIRIMVVFGWVRVILRGETTSWQRTGLDSAMILFIIANVIFYTLQRRTLSAFVTSMGGAFDMVGLYFLFRLLLSDVFQASVVLRILAWLAVPMAVFMLIEQFTGRNFFSMFGGVPEFTLIRMGRLRSQASFQHPILAGTFGATLVPLLVGMSRMGIAQKRSAALGVFSAIIITVTSASSGPVFALLMGTLALLFWKVSIYMREVRLLLVLMIVGLQLVMKSPVYALIGRVPLVGGSTGFYRFLLINQFFSRFKDWWLMGVQSTAYWGEGLFDVTNQYIRVAVNGGLLTLILFLLVIATAFKEIGWSLRVLNRHTQEAERFFMWGLGATLFSHIVSFLSVNYFDQIIVIWFMLLAMITTLSQSIMLSATRKTVAIHG
jgi:hypothetical protein